MGYPFEEQLKEELAELGALKEEVEATKRKYEEKRNQIQKWMEVNELSSFETKDNNEEEWSIKFEPRRNRRVRDHKLLKEALGDNYNEFINEFESSVFKVGRKNRKGNSKK